MSAVIDRPELATLLARLHADSERELVERAQARFVGTATEFSRLLDEYRRLAPRAQAALLREHRLTRPEGEAADSGLSLAISAATGEFLHNLVLLTGAEQVLELGSSRGVSTLYLASALRKLGRGRVTAIESDPAKCEVLREHLRLGGVDDFVHVYEGDLFDHLARLDDCYDVVFLDIFADRYLDAFAEIEPRLRRGSVVVADNMFSAETELGAFRDYIRSRSRYSTTTVEAGSGLEFIVVA